MKNLKTFENYTEIPMEDNTPIKSYGSPYPLTNLNIGDKLVYRGSKGVVKKVDEYILVITLLGSGNDISVNQSMFNSYGFIGK
jgi:hypothetical protein